MLSFNLFFIFRSDFFIFIFSSALSRGGYPRRGTRGATRGPEVIYESVTRGSRGSESIYGVQEGQGGICQHGWGTISLSSLSQSNYSISNISGILNPEEYRGVCSSNRSFFRVGV